MFKQIFCNHWFDIIDTKEIEFSEGIIVCGEQRLFTAIKETRKCSKCDFEESRNKNIECIGWD